MPHCYFTGEVEDHIPSSEPRPDQEDLEINKFLIPLKTQGVYKLPLSGILPRGGEIPTTQDKAGPFQQTKWSTSRTYTMPNRLFSVQNVEL